MIGIVFLGDRRIERREFSMPEPADDQVLVAAMCTTGHL
jgi:hypothetical protein